MHGSKRKFKFNEVLAIEFEFAIKLEFELLFNLSFLCVHF